jgi:hypothetical protein
MRRWPLVTATGVLVATMTSLKYLIYNIKRTKV